MTLWRLNQTNRVEGGDFDMMFLAQQSIQTAFNQGYWLVLIAGLLVLICVGLWAVVEMALHRNLGMIAVLVVCGILGCAWPTITRAMLNSMTGANITLTSQAID